MAIHPIYHGLKAEVVVNDQALTEYPDDVEGERGAIVKHVEAVSGAYFGVRFMLPNEHFKKYDLGIRISIDGKLVS